MKSFFTEQWKALALLSFPALWIGVFPIWSNWILKPPLNEPISLATAGSIKEVIEVRSLEPLELTFIFDREGQSFEELKRLIGDGGVCVPPTPCTKGVNVPLAWAIREFDTLQVVASGNSDTFDANGWSSNEIHRHITRLDLPPGKYEFSAAVLRPVTELSHVATRLRLSIRSKSDQTWQMGAVWWGSIGKVLLAWPIGIYALFMLFRASLARRQKTH
ncbi:DUF5625 family protein [Halopseudomonas pelagia]|uniref:DUF5625 family protein n=1 Tax=Halopseudomonas pelagia TaxID=553151 RepID=UPI0003B7A5F2